MTQRKRNSLAPVFTEKELTQIVQIVQEWESMPEWERSNPGQPSKDFRARITAYVNRPVRGRPQRQSRDTMEQAIRELNLKRSKNYTYREIREELYPRMDYRMEDQIRKRVNRLQRLLKGM